MEYRVTLATAAPNLAVIDDAIRDADPAALVDQDPADGTLRVTAWINAEELAAVLAQAGIAATRVELQPSVCCGDCSG
ncbi:MAG TPA: hypothetical protein PK789_10730 [Thermomonas sp.]|jgi:hypothetical protein|uniref:hypothetical protein n=1 Tax=Thermomonas sp. TaxID=1971895 RepID=UPI002B889A0C|nr:hypothetical protein [Thermomonas sp.]HOV97218.1 hypothetical protein [Thermomonas sp.]